MALNITTAHKGFRFETRATNMKSYHIQNSLLSLRLQRKLSSLSAVTSGPHVVKRQNFWTVKRRFLDKQIMGNI
jgi:hypothetical protein